MILPLAAQTKRNPTKHKSDSVRAVFERALQRHTSKLTQFRITRGLDFAIAGKPRQEISDGQVISTVAMNLRDYPGMRPELRVVEGQRVAAGQSVFVDRHRPEIAFTAPVAGTVAKAMGRVDGTRQPLLIHVDGDETMRFAPAPGPRADVQRFLLASGLWPAFRARPFGRIPNPGSVPDALFVTAIDTDPLAADPAVVIASYRDAFDAGIDALRKLTDGPLFVCQGVGAPLSEDAISFAGPHPAGLPGTHIHFLKPVGRGRTVWHIGYQDVIAIGHLCKYGTMWTDRIVSVAGPAVGNPRLVRTRLGASIDELTDGEYDAPNMRLISGSVLSGREDTHLGRYHLQVSVFPEKNAARPRLLHAGPLSTALNGGLGPLIPLAMFDRVMPLDILPVPLLRALSVGDSETAERLGCLELIEEDVALLSYVCPGKNNYAHLLRAVLDEIEAGL